MSFGLSDAINSSNVFIARKTDLIKRWDPHYHSPRFTHLDPELDAIGARQIYKVSQSIFSGITPLSGGDAYTENLDGIAFIRSGDFNEDGTINESALIRLKREVHEKQMRRSQLKPKDVLFAIVGATIGKVGIFPGGFEANINQAVAAVRLSHSVLPHFLHAFFLTRLGQEQIERIKRPVARANINLEEVGTLRIPVLSEKKQIAVITALSKAFAQKFATESKASLLLEGIDDLLLDELGIPRTPEPPNTLENRIFQSSFVASSGSRWDPLYHQGDIFYFICKGKCAIKKLGEQVEYFLTGFPAGRGEQADEDDGGIIQIRPTNIGDDRELVFNRNVYISTDKLKIRKKDILKRHEVLFNNTNSQELVGKSVWFNLEGDYFSSNHITRIGVRHTELNSQYLVHILNLYQRRKVFFKLCTNWNNQSGVGADILRYVPIPIPSLPQQSAIVDHIETARLKVRDLRKQAKDDLEKAKRDIEFMIFGKEAAE